MELINTNETSLNVLRQKQIDCLICCSGFEKRATFLASQLNLENIENKYVLKFDNFRTEPSRILNDDFFELNNFVSLEFSGNDSLFFGIIWSEISKKNNNEVIRIVLDYSSMTRLWYSSAISFIRDLKIGPKVVFYFCYSFSSFVNPINSSLRNLHIDPIPGFSKMTSPDKPTALVIGLGYEKERAFGLSEYFDAETYVFFTDNIDGSDYQKYVKDANEAILEYVKDENLFEYSLEHLENAESLLFSLCNSLNRDYRIVIAPTGPKPFTLLCLLTSIRLENIDVWRISAGNSIRPINKIPTGQTSIYKAVFE